MGFFSRKTKIHPEIDLKQRKEAPVNTKGKTYFKNLRLRTKLRTKEVDTPDVVKQQIEKVSRFRRFINFFKRSGKFRLKRGNKVSSELVLTSKGSTSKALPAPPAAANTQPGPSTNGEIEEHFDDYDDSSEAELSFAEDETEEDLSESVTDGGTKAMKAQTEFFNNIDSKVQLGKKNQLPPIEGGDIKILRSKDMVFDKNYAAFTLSDEQARTPSRMSKRAISRMSTYNNDSGIMASKETIMAKQIRAEERRLAKAEELRRKRERADKNRKNAAAKAAATADAIRREQEAARAERQRVALLNKQRFAETKDLRTEVMGNNWKRRHHNQICRVEQERQNAIQNVEVKKQKTEEVLQRKKAFIKTRKEKLRKKHDKIAVDIELRRAETPLPPVVTGPIDPAFDSRQPKNELEPLILVDNERPGTPYPKHVTDPSFRSRQPQNEDQPLVPLW